MFVVRHFLIFPILNVEFLALFFFLQNWYVYNLISNIIINWYTLRRYILWIILFFLFIYFFLTQKFYVVLTLSKNLEI